MKRVPSRATKTHGHTGVPQTRCDSTVHSFSAVVRLQPCCRQRVPSDPGALQNCTTEQLVAGLITSIEELVLDLSSRVIISNDDIEGSSSFQLPRASLGASFVG